MSKQLEITLTRSVIGQNGKQRDTVQSLGLTKVNQTIVRDDTPAVRGMLDKVAHLVAVKEMA